MAILDADKEGFLRSAGSLIQTMGRAARNVHGKAILYADTTTDSMRAAIAETSRRRAKQLRYNEDNGITPESIVKPVDMALAGVVLADYIPVPTEVEADEPRSLDELEELVVNLEKQMREAAKEFEFERAAELRDRIKALRNKAAGLVTEHQPD